KKPSSAIKKTFTSKAAKAITLPDNLEDGAVSDALIFNTGPSDAPIKPITFEKVRKYLLKEILEKKG
ncbi:hypothetical protein GE21DRAFT_1178106, partial [Neurospora crassa]